MADDWATAFSARNDGTVVDIQSVGSLAGVEAAANGDCMHVLAISEAMTGRQQNLLNDNGIEIQCSAEIGYDVIAFVTDNNNDTPTILERHMENVLVGRFTDWDDVRGDEGPIYIYVRRGSATTDYVLKQFNWQAGESTLPPIANYLECDSNGDCLDRTLSTLGSLFWVSTAWMKTQPSEYLRVMPILRNDEFPSDPMREGFDIRRYPNRLIRPLYMYVLQTPNMSDEESALARDWLRYVRGVDGQQVLEDHFFYNHFNRPIDVAIDYPNGFPILGDFGEPRACRES